MAKLTPISREDANAGINACRTDPASFELKYGDWTACCTEDENLKTTCIVCDKDENCSLYTEFRDVQDLFNLLELGPALKLAPIETAPEPTDPKKTEY